MRIKKLDICGFKSFMDRSVFQFDDRVTGVVGPNGCGKSNVVDAIRWAMGEQSARHLRGRAMEDVIFNGSESKGPLSMAEVTLTFSNDTPDLLPAQYKGFSEITVTRRLFRSGESEYLINKTPCRLLDVSELFLGTGVGTKGYSIIEQGRIGLIVSAKPEDRRKLIEEAAGITLYQSRRKAAERKMELTEQNLTRIRDVTRELGRRLDSLGRQARKAEKYKRLKSEIRDIELRAASMRYLELTALLRASRQVADALEAEDRTLGQAIGEREASLEALERSLRQAEERSRSLADQTHAADNAFKVGQANLEAYQRELADLDKRVREGHIEQVELESAEKATALELDRLREASASLEGSTIEEQRMGEVLLRIEAVTAEDKTAQRALEVERGQLMAVMSRLASGQTHLENMSRQRTELHARAEAARVEIATLQERICELEAARESALAKLNEARQLKIALEARRADEENNLATLRMALVESEVRLIAERETLGDKRSRVGSLKEIQENYEGFGRGVRAVMGRKKSDVLGLVSDLIRAPVHLEKAIEAALGERLQTIVVPGQESALAELAFLKSNDEGRVAFLPRQPNGDRARSSGPMPTEASLPGFIGFADRLIDVDAPYRALAEHLLGHVAVVSDVDAALAFLKLNRPDELAVTLDGEVLEPSGALSCGALEGAGVGALHKKREIAELEGEVARLDEEHREAQARHRELAERASEIEVSLKGLSNESHSEALQVVEQEKDLHKATEDLAQARSRLAKLETSLDEMARGLTSLSDRETALVGESAQAEAERGARETRVAELSEALTRIRLQMGELLSERTELQVKTAAESERREGIARALSRAQKSEVELCERRRRLQNTLEQRETRRTEIAALIQTTGEEIERLKEAHANLEGEGKKALQARDELSEKVRADNAALRLERQAFEKLQGAHAEQAMRVREQSFELSHLESAIRDRYNVELREALFDHHCQPLPTESEAARLRDMREQIEKMGEVNLTAIEECAEVSERHGQMEKQQQDLERSLSHLRKAIVRINKTSKDRFRQAFDAINEKFQQLFPRLFNGGSAGLILTESEDGESEPGIEIMAQPPGKKLQSVNLLSGGEKALTAVSLIFAIFLIKPTPFCLLDEVDAPLDEANVARYNELIREMSQLSQFILITHNKRTMQVADTLYGVTMQEPGISSLVAVKMSRLAANEATGEEASKESALSAS
ncbi:MAG: chromosome segregation protein SMC [Myxococcales bacterium]|jgi:chromosome segregation protein|nr:chromosome segregation protein SMC [Myxococcales bacterium]